MVKQDIRLYNSSKLTRSEAISPTSLISDIVTMSSKCLPYFVSKQATTRIHVIMTLQRKAERSSSKAVHQ